MFDKNKFAIILRNISETYSNQREFARKSNINRTYLSQYMNMKLDKPPKIDILMKLAHASNGITKYSELMEICGYTNDWSKLNEVVDTEKIKEDIKQYEKSAIVLIYGTIPAGIPMEMIEDIIDTEEISTDMLKGGKQYFGLRVKGNSMYPEYLDGDTLILEKLDDVESGSDAVVMVNGNDGTFKRVFKNENGIILQPINPEFQPMVYTNEQIEKLPVKVIGKVVELRRKK